MSQRKSSLPEKLEPGCGASPSRGPGGLGVPHVVVIVVVFAWVLGAAALGVPVAMLTGLLVTAGAVAANLIGRAEQVHIPSPGV